MQFAKPEPGMPIVFPLSGQNIELRFSLGTLKALDAEHQISVLKGGKMAEAFQDPALLSIVLYYGMREKQPDITQEWVDTNVTAGMLLDLAPLLAYATTGRWPDMDKILGNAIAPDPIAGLVSGPSGAMTSNVVNGKFGA